MPNTIHSPLLSVNPIAAFNDNYIWILTLGNKAVVVDPGDAVPVEHYLFEHDLILEAILITHHHADHTGGIVRLHEKTNAKVYGPANEKIPYCDIKVKEQDSVLLFDNAVKLSVVDVPGHTLGHVAYFGGQANQEPYLFCGDTLFSVGCGRIFEGDSKKMKQALDKFRKMPQNTHMCCAHEYTLSNIRWALAVDSNNEALLQWSVRAQELRAQGLPTVPTTLALECAVNPFLRTNDKAVVMAANSNAGKELSTEVEVFAQLREWKNSF